MYTPSLKLSEHLSNPTLPVVHIYIYNYLLSLFSSSRFKYAIGAPTKFTLPPLCKHAHTNTVLGHGGEGDALGLH